MDHLLLHSAGAPDRTPPCCWRTCAAAACAAPPRHVARHRRFRGDALAALLSTLGADRRLEELDLGGNQWWGPSGALTQAAFLRVNTSLRTLRCDGNAFQL